MLNNRMKKNRKRSMSKKYLQAQIHMTTKKNKKAHKFKNNNLK